MVKAILFVFSIVLIVVGLCDVIYVLKMLFCYPGIRCNNCVIVELKNNYAVRQLNFIWQKIKWHGDGYANCIIALTDYLDFNEVSDCFEFTEGKNIVLCDLNSLSHCECLQGEYINGNR